jgi:magnesium transporter
MAQNIVDTLHAQFFSNHPKEAALQLEKLPIEEATKWLVTQKENCTDRIWPLLAKDILYRIFTALGDEKKASVISLLPMNEIAPLWDPLDDATQQDVLSYLSPEMSKAIANMPRYDADSIGSLISPQSVLLRPDMYVDEALTRVKHSKNKHVRVLFVVDDNNKLLGHVEIATLALAEEDNKVKDILKAGHLKILPNEKQEAVIDRLNKADLRELAITDDNEHFLGVVKPEQLIQASKEDAVADIGRMVGVSKDETALSPAWIAIKKRLPWLQVNLLTAFLAASVVGLFEGTIAKFTALAVLLPIVAGQSGNTGAQALAVTMRSLALNEITLKHSFAVLFKETKASIVNGVAVALTTALAVGLWSMQVGLAVVIGVSMVLSMVLAAIAGASVPLILTKLKQDPAQSASIILTTVTDVFGFFTFLGIATAFSSLL